MSQENARTAPIPKPAAKPFAPAANPQSNAPVFIPPAPDQIIAKGQTKLVSIRMLSTRPTGAAGVQPFKVRDVRDAIDPERRRMLAALGANCSGSTASAQNTSVSFLLPANGAACSFPPSSGVVGNPDVVFTLTNFTPTTAMLVPQNGWTVTPTAVLSDESSGTSNNVTIIKNGVTYSLTLTVYSDQVNPGEGTGSISNFMPF